MAITLGSMVRDKITGLEGIAVARTVWLHGCVLVTIQPQLVKDGKAVDTSWIDEPQCEVVATAGKSKPKPSGGPQEPAQRHPDPKR